MLAVDGFGGNGGIAQYNRDVVEAWSSDDDVGEITILPRFASRREPPLPSKARQGRPVENVLAYGLRALVHSLKSRPYDVVFCAHLHMIPLAFVVAKLSSARLWLQLHGIEAWRRRSALSRWCAEGADVVTAVSRHTRRRFLSWADLDTRRVVVVPNTVGAQFSGDDTRSSCKRAFGLADKRVLLTVARLARSEGYKGHDRVIRTLPRLLRRFDDLAYVIAGEGDLRADLERLARELEVEGAVHFVGHVENADLAQLYRAADLFIMPSTGEGFGIVFLEALACGTPVLAGDADGASDPLQDGRLGCLCDDSHLEVEIMRQLESSQAPENGPASARLREAAVERHFGKQVFRDLIASVTASIHSRNRRQPADSLQP